MRGWEDVHRSRYAKIELQPGAFPNGIDNEYDARRSRDYIVVIRTSDRRVELIVEGPQRWNVNPYRLEEVLMKEMMELSSRYRRPEYDIAVGQGSLYSVGNGLAWVRGWDNAPIKEVQV